MIKSLCWLLVLMWLSLPLCAQQQHFTQSRDNAGQQFSYRWQDRAQQPQEISFTLPAASLNALTTTQPSYRKAIAQRYIWVQMMEAAKEIDPRQARVDIRPRGDDILLQVRSADEATYDKVYRSLQQAQQTAYTEYLQKHYYTRFVTPYREQAVKPDHIRYIQESIEPLIPLSQAFYEQLSEQSDAREYLNLLLGWVQSIPYDALEDRTQTNGAGFSPPLALLTQNKGDCDSKAVLTAAAVRAFLPATPMVLILLREHAVLGLALTPVAGETTIAVDGTRYMVFDPTGPALQPFGQVSAETRRELASGLFVTETID